MRKSYYILEAEIAPGWTLPYPKPMKVKGGKLEGAMSSRPADASKWRDPPHVALANLGYAPEHQRRVAPEESIRKFTETYGPLGAKLGPILRGEADAVPEPEEPFYLELHAFHWNQRNLREAWEKRDVRIFTDPDNLSTTLGHDWLPIAWGVRGGRLEMLPVDCRSYMGILLARDIATGCAKVCQNPGCVAPYFVAKRRDTKFCSHPCASAVNVKKFRRREKAARKRKR